MAVWWPWQSRLLTFGTGLRIANIVAKMENKISVETASTQIPRGIEL